MISHATQTAADAQHAVPGGKPPLGSASTVFVELDKTSGRWQSNLRGSQQLRKSKPGVNRHLKLASKKLATHSKSKSLVNSGSNNSTRAKTPQKSSTKSTEKFDSPLPFPPSKSPGLIKMPVKPTEEQSQPRMDENESHNDNHSSLLPMKLKLHDSEKLLETFTSNIQSSSTTSFDNSKFAGNEGTRISDLCDKDKAKIANLIQKLMKTDAENENYQLQLKKQKQEFEDRILSLKGQNDKVVKETINIRTKFGRSLEMLRTYQAKLVQLQEIHNNMTIRSSEDERQMKELQEEVARLYQLVLNQSLQHQESTMHSYTDHSNLNLNQMRSQQNQTSSLNKTDLDEMRSQWEDIKHEQGLLQEKHEAWKQKQKQHNISNKEKSTEAKSAVDNSRIEKDKFARTSKPVLLSSTVSHSSESFEPIQAFDVIINDLETELKHAKDDLAKLDLHHDNNNSGFESLQDNIQYKLKKRIVTNLQSQLNNALAEKADVMANFKAKASMQDAATESIDLEVTADVSVQTVPMEKNIENINHSANIAVETTIQNTSKRKTISKPHLKSKTRPPSKEERYEQSLLEYVMTKPRNKKPIKVSNQKSKRKPPHSYKSSLQKAKSVYSNTSLSNSFLPPHHRQSTLPPNKTRNSRVNSRKDVSRSRFHDESISEIFYESFQADESNFEMSLFDLIDELERADVHKDEINT